VNVIDDFAQYSEQFLRIVTKDGRLCPFVQNVYQRKAEYAYRHAKQRGWPIRIIELKARQVGGSTWGSGKMFQSSSTNPFTNSFVVAHDAESTDNIFRMHKVFLDRLHEDVRPMLKYNSKTLLDFQNPSSDEVIKTQSPGLMSSIRVGTAGNTKIGRSKTNRNAHLSELAFYESAGQIVTGVCQTVPAKPDTFIFKESTANGIEGGIGEQFYIDWNEAVRRDVNTPGYIPVFCAWFENPEYEMDLYYEFKAGDQKDKYGDEAALYAYLKDPTPLEIGVTITAKGFEHNQIMRKLMWRRFKIDNDMGKDSTLDPLSQWDQEYPQDPDIAFISSGRPVFPNKLLRRDIQELDMYPPDIDKLQIGVPEAMAPNLRVFHKPKKDKRYAIGVDVSEGLIEGDASDIRVIDEDFNECALWHGKVDEDTLGVWAVALARIYNNAILAIEVNNMGIATINAAKRIYGNFYLRKVQEKISEGYTEKIGWRTDKKTKNILIIDLKQYYRDRLTKILDKDLLTEMMSVSREPDGSVVTNGKDRVMAYAIAIQAAKEIPHITRAVEFPDREEKVFDHRTKEDYLKYLDQLAKKETEDQWDDQY